MSPVFCTSLTHWPIDHDHHCYCGGYIVRIAALVDGDQEVGKLIWLSMTNPPHDRVLLDPVIAP